MIAELASLPGLLVLVPLLAAGLLAAVRQGALAGRLNVAAAALALGIALAMLWWPRAGALLLVDRLAAHMAILAALMGLAAAWPARRSLAPRERQDAALMQAFQAAVLLALLSSHPSIAWLAFGAAGMALTALVGRDRRPVARRAGRIGFVLCAAAAGLALFGTVLLDIAAPHGLHWSMLPDALRSMPRPTVRLAFVFLAVGGLALVGIVPLHGGIVGLGTTPVTALLAASLGQVALILLLRAWDVVVLTGATDLLGALGAITVLLAALGLQGARDTGHLLTLAGIFQRGLVLCALATPFGRPFALLHLSLSTLALAAVAALPNASRERTQAIGLAALALLPPFALAASFLRLFGELVRAAPWLAVPVAAGAVLAGWAIGARAVEHWRAPARAAAGRSDVALSWLLLAALVAVWALPPDAVGSWLAELSNPR